MMGSSAVSALSSEHDVVGIYNSNKVEFKGAKTIQSDLASPESVNLITSLSPDIVLNCAALTDVDRCEKNPEEAYRHNVETAIHVSQGAMQSKARLIHVSTDAVFDGREGRYDENDTPNPVNEYGRSKWAAERVIRSVHGDSIVVRTNIYGCNKHKEKKSLAEWILGRLQNNKTVPGFEDVYFSPIYTNQLISIVERIIPTSVTGLLHVAGRDRISKYSFAEMVADVFGYKNSQIITSSIDEVNLEAPRPTDCSLDSSYVEKKVGSRLPSTKEGLKRFKKDYIKK